MLFLFHSIFSLETSSWRCVLKVVCSEPWLDGTSTLEGALHHMPVTPLVERHPGTVQDSVSASWPTTEPWHSLPYCTYFWCLSGTSRRQASLRSCSQRPSLLGSWVLCIRISEETWEEEEERKDSLGAINIILTINLLIDVPWLCAGRKNFEQSFLQPLELCSLTYDELEAHSLVPQYLNRSSFCALNKCHIKII